MARLENLLAQDSNRDLLGTDKSFIDADTLRDEEGNKYRLQGVNALETTHYDYKNNQLKPGQVGGQMSTDQIAKLANDMGYTNVVEFEDEAAFGRATFDLQDKSGRSFRRQLAASGILPVDPRYDSSRLQESADYGAFLRTAKDYRAHRLG